MSKKQAKAKNTRKLTCKTCSSTFEVVHGNAKYCSPECRPKPKEKKTQTMDEYWEEVRREQHETRLRIMKANPGMKYEDVGTYH